MAKLVSQVYAEALFGLGVENGLLDTLLEELNGMCEILGKNPQFVTLLGHPELDQKEKTAVFDRVFDGKISKELNGFAIFFWKKADLASCLRSVRITNAAVWLIIKSESCM